MWEYNYSGYDESYGVYHYGIKGMKWGVRRFENKNGSLTSAGRKRYKTDIVGAKDKVNKARIIKKEAAKKYNKASWYGINTASKRAVEAGERLTAADEKLWYTKKVLKDEKIKERLNNETKKSKRRLKLEETYRNKGLTEEEAAIAAYKREKTEKIVAVTATMTIAAAAAYAGYKYHNYVSDKVIKAGSTFQRYDSNDILAVRDGFYFTSGKRDDELYKGYFGKHLAKQNKSVYRKILSAKDDIKIASDKKALETFRDLYKNNKDFKSNATKLIEDESFGELKENAIRKLKQGKIDKTVYDAFNQTLVGGTDPALGQERATTIKTFYDSLKKQGYDAFGDINDKKYSGFNAKTASIMIDAGKTAVDKVESVSADQVNKAFNKEVAKRAVNISLGLIGSTSSAVLLSNTINNASKDFNNKRVVDQYRKEHPGTKLSNTEILNMHYGT